MKRYVCLIFVSALVACGGSGGGTSGDGVAASAPANPVPADTAEGLWTGTTNNGRTVAGVVLDDATYWVLYSGINDPSRVAGLIHGNSTSSNGNFSSSDARDFNLEGLE